MSTLHRFLVISLFFALLTPAVTSAQPAAALAIDSSPAPAGSTLFVENAGQWPGAARFQVWGSPAGVGTTWLAEDAIWIAVAGGKSQVARSPEAKRSGGSDTFAGRPSNLQPETLPPATLQPATLTALKLTFPGSNPDVRIEPFEPLTTTVSYFLGNDPGQWYPAVQVYGGVRYADLYPGVDLVLGKADEFWRLEAGPGAATSQIRVQVAGAPLLTLDGARLYMDVDQGPLSVLLPEANFAYQASGVSRQGAPLAMMMYLGDHVPTSTRSNDNPQDLIYSTFLGASENEYASTMVVDSTGQVTLAGNTWSNTFPITPGAFDPGYSGGNFIGGDAFVTRLSADGSALVYSTFLGGTAADGAEAITVDGAGRATVTGWTFSSDFPATSSAFDSTHNGEVDGFVTRISPDGRTLVYSTFLGGCDSDFGYAVALHGSSQVTIAGRTDSGNFPITPGAYDTTSNGLEDTFITRLSADGSTLSYSTFLGGTSADWASDIATDGSENVTIVGYTESSDFPTTPGVFDPTHNGFGDAFVARLNAQGNALIYSTFLGGGALDQASAVAVDAAGNAAVTGRTFSGNFPVTSGAFDTSLGGYRDAFVARVSTDGRTLVYSSYLGGSNGDDAYAIALDAANQAIVAGRTESNNFPTTPGAYDTVKDGAYDAFVARLSVDGRALVYGTFLGGSYSDEGWSIAIDSANRIATTGYTYSNDFPTSPGAFDRSFNGGDYGYDAFVSRLDLTPYAPSVVAPIEQPGTGAFVTGTVTLLGFAIDLDSSNGTGIDRVAIYLDGPYGLGAFLGEPTYGLNRPDIAAQYGARFGPSGWELAWDTSGITPGMHRLYLYAHRTTDDSWSQKPPHLLVVRADHVYWLPLGYRS